MPAVMWLSLILRTGLFCLLVVSPRLGHAQSRLQGVLEPFHLGQPHDTTPWLFGEVWLALRNPNGQLFLIDTDIDSPLYDQLFDASGFSVELEGVHLAPRPEVQNVGAGVHGSFVAKKINWKDKAGPADRIRPFISTWQSEDGQTRIQVQRHPQGDSRKILITWDQGPVHREFDATVGGLNISGRPNATTLPAEIRQAQFRYGNFEGRKYRELVIATYPIAKNHVFAPSLERREFPVSSAQHLALRLYGDDHFTAEMYDLRVLPNDETLTPDELLKQNPSMLCKQLIKHADLQGAAFFNRLYNIGG